MKRSIVLLSGLAVALAASVLFISGTQAVQNKDFELDGNIRSTGVSPDPHVDWEDLFDVVGDDVPTTKAVLPANFKRADFVRDFVPGESGPDRTTFATGSKDTLSVTPGWQCARDNNVNDKTDVVNAYATAFNDGTDTILYFALERYSNGGAGNVAFWFLQDETVDCIAPASGPSTTDFTGNHEDGDILVVAEFTVGGTVNTINAYQWVGGAGGFLDPSPIASGADCSTSPAGVSICAIVNGSLLAGYGPGTAVPWLTETKQSGNTPSNDLDVSEFFEAGLNLSALGRRGATVGSSPTPAARPASPRPSSTTHSAT